MDDFYAFNNFISENILKFYDYLTNQASNAADKLSQEALDTIRKMTKISIDYCEAKNENNIIKNKLIGKLPNYLMTFILNDRLNEEKAKNLYVKKLLNDFWEFFYNLLIIDENNFISGK